MKCHKCGYELGMTGGMKIHYDAYAYRIGWCRIDGKDYCPRCQDEHFARCSGRAHDQPEVEDKQ